MKLQSDVDAAQAYLHIPDQIAQSAWAQALTFLASAASDCVSGIDKNDAAVSSKADNEMLEGSDELQVLKGRLGQLGVLV
jgi:hypothetical protein